MLNRWITSIERLGSLGMGGSWVWRIVGGAISIGIMVIILMVLR
jgi:hypothetical protein